MNKHEIKSAYNKVRLSDEFKASAKEKLIDMAKGNISSQEDISEMPSERGIEIKPQPVKRKPWSVVFGVSATAAAIALIALGGKWLLDNNAVLLSTLSSAFSSEPVSDIQITESTPYKDEPVVSSEEIADDDPYEEEIADDDPYEQTNKPVQEITYKRLEYQKKANGVDIWFQWIGEEAADSVVTDLSNYKPLSDVYNSTDYAIYDAVDFTSMSGIGLVGAASPTAEYNGAHVLEDYRLDAENSYVSNEKDSFILRYTNVSGGEIYLNIYDYYSNYTTKYVESPEHTVFFNSGTEPCSVICSEKNMKNHNIFNIRGNECFLGGVEKDGIKYYEGGTGCRNDSLKFVHVSAKGMSEEEFSDLMIVITQGSYNCVLSGVELKHSTHEVKTDFGTLVINDCEPYAVANAGNLSDVYNIKLIDEATGIYYREDVTEFVDGNRYFINPILSFEPDPKQLQLEYQANYAEFRAEGNYELFLEGLPLNGEIYDEAFKEAQKYFDNGVYYSDRLDYFADKTPIFRKFTLYFFEEGIPDNGSKYVTISATRGEFSQNNVANMLLQKSFEFCQNVATIDADDPENANFVYAVQYLGLDKSFYGGFYHNEVYYEVETTGLSASEFADVLAGLFFGSRGMDAFEEQKLSESIEIPDIYKKDFFIHNGFVYAPCDSSWDTSSFVVENSKPLFTIRVYVASDLNNLYNRSSSSLPAGTEVFAVKDQKNVLAVKYNDGYKFYTKLVEG